MNILNDDDLRNYFKHNQMFLTKDFFDWYSQKIFKKHKTYDILGISIDRKNENALILNIMFFKDIDNIEFENLIIIRECTKLELYAEMKTTFLPVTEMYEAWQFCDKNI